METTEINSSESNANDPSNQPNEADALFARFLACNPGPTHTDLIRLLRAKTLSKKKVLAAIIAHPGIDIRRPDCIVFDRKYILDAWEFIPIERITDEVAIRIIKTLYADPKCRQLCHQLGQYLIATGRTLDSIIKHIPELAEEAWSKLISLEDNDTDVVDVVLDFEDAEVQKQKILWILRHRPLCACEFVSHSDAEVATLASTIVLGERTPPDSYALSGIAYAGEQHLAPSDLAQKAIDLLLGQHRLTDDLLARIVSMSCSTTPQKERAADILLSREPGSFLVQILDHVPSRVERATQALRQLERIRAEKEAARPEKDRLLDMLIRL